MTITASQQGEIDYQRELQKIRDESEINRFELEKKAEERRTRLVLLSTAKEIIIENNKNKPVSDRTISHDEVIELATSLKTFMED
jgi:hypothetical protein